MSNTFGNLFRLTTFGESHGPALGGVVDGCPAGVTIDREAIERELRRRQPGRWQLSSQRKEIDDIEFLSGLFNGITTGTPIAYLIRNKDARSEDYRKFEDIYRPGHADFTYEQKYGIRDYRGGGRASGRETIARVVGGAIAKQLLASMGITIYGYTSQIGSIIVREHFTESQMQQVTETPICCPDTLIAEQMEKLIEQVHSQGDSIGGAVTIVVKGVPAGWGEPVFDKLQSLLAYAVTSIGGVKGFEYGEGFAAAQMRGSEMNDAMDMQNGKPHFKSNHAGGILGGISNGEDIYFRVAFKPTPSIAMPQQSITNQGQQQTIEVTGRHDACIVPRALVVVEAMTAMALYDAYRMTLNQTI